MNIERHLQALANAGFITRYEADGKRFIAIPKFKKHQSPHVNEASSTIQAPEQHHTSTIQAPDDSHSNLALTLNPSPLTRVRSSGRDSGPSPEPKAAAVAAVEKKPHARAENKNEWSGDDIEAWFETLYARYPKKGAKSQARQLVTQIPSIDAAVTRGRIDRAVDDWAASEDWQWNNGAKVPTLATFIVDDLWKHEPPKARAASGTKRRSAWEQSEHSE